MDKKTEIFVDVVGDFLRDLMKDRGITANHMIVNHGIDKQRLYAVLRMGDPRFPDYRISTLVKVLGILDVL